MTPTAINQAGQLAENLSAFTLLQHLIEVLQDPGFPETSEVLAMRQIFLLEMCGEA